MAHKTKLPRRRRTKVSPTAKISLLIPGLKRKGYNPIEIERMAMHDVTFSLGEFEAETLRAIPENKIREALVRRDLTCLDEWLQITSPREPTEAHILLLEQILLVIFQK